MNLHLQSVFERRQLYGITPNLITVSLAKICSHPPPKCAHIHSLVFVNIQQASMNELMNVNRCKFSTWQSLTTYLCFVTHLYAQLSMLTPVRAWWHILPCKRIHLSVFVFKHIFVCKFLCILVSVYIYIITHIFQSMYIVDYVCTNLRVKLHIQKSVFAELYS